MSWRCSRDGEVLRAISKLVLRRMFVSSLPASRCTY